MRVQFAASAVTLALLGAMAACSSSGLDVNPDDYDQLPWLADLDYEQVVPAASHDYWEFRYVTVGAEQADSVIGSGGTLTRAELDTAVIAVLDTLSAAPGFALECLPGLCYKYVVAVDGTALQIYNTPEELATFLGEIGSWEEAAMLINAYDYFWSTTSTATGGIREVDDGYEAVVLELVAACVPVQINRTLLHVSSAGVVEQLDTEVWSKDQNACI